MTGQITLQFSDADYAPIGARPPIGDAFLWEIQSDNSVILNVFFLSAEGLENEPYRIHLYSQLDSWFKRRMIDNLTISN